jgi:N-acetylmuramoyl-L-alanine amidase
LKAEGITTLMTRSDDTFVSLSDRARFTNQLRDCILVSIHFNDTQRALATGVETYYAEHQNAPVPMLMRWIPFVSKGSPAGPANIESQSLAGLIQEAVVTRTHALDRGAKPRQFYVISNVTHPAVLVEGGFLSNKEDVTKLANTEYRDQLATAIAEGIMRYRELVKERQTTLAVTTGAGR